MSGVPPIVGASNFCPAIAVPMTVKIPDPITAPIPSAVSDHGPRLFFNEFWGSSDSRISLSMDLRASSWLARSVLLTSTGKVARGALPQNSVHLEGEELL
jgi:hypothetical protein